jgi:predicted secreted protein
MNHLPLKILFLTLLCALLNLTFGCSRKQGPKTVPVYSEPKVPIKQQAGDRFILALASNPSTGYSWKFAVPVGGKVLKLVQSDFKAPEQQIPGRGGEERWTFQAVGKGHTAIKLNYLRPWEKNTPPAKTAVFDVTVE